MSEKPVLRLVDRLRGIYILAVNDGCGPLDGEMTFERQYTSHPLQQEAALIIEALEDNREVDFNDIVNRLLALDDPFGTGKPYVVPIRKEAAERIKQLIGECDV